MRAVSDDDPKLAVMEARSWPVTDFVRIGNVVEDFPAGTTTVVGTETAPLPQLNRMMSPPGPAGELRVTDPRDDVPPITLLGAMLRFEIFAGVTVRIAVAAADPSFAVIVALVCAETGLVAIGKVA